MNEPGAGAATQIYSHRFDHRFFALPSPIQHRLQDKIDEMGRRLRSFPHYRMEGLGTYRLRVGDYRVIYDFDAAKLEMFLMRWVTGGTFINKPDGII